MASRAASRSDHPASPLLERGAELLAAGDMAGALAAFEEGARRHPREWRFPCNAGTVLHRMGRVGEALRAVNRALQLAPGEVLPYHKLGTWLMELEQREAALRLFERAAALPGAKLESLLQWGVALLESKDVERALAVVALALESAPASAEAHALLGMALAARGERAASDAALERALELDPACAQAAYHLARRGAALDPQPLRAPAEDPRLPAAGRSKLCFALGSLYDRRGEHAEAFAWFARANALVRASWDPARSSATTDALIALCRGEFFARGACARPAAAPIFIVGLPRTGSTLLEEFLAGHPLVHAAGEHSQGLPRIVRELPSLAPLVRPFPQGLGDLDGSAIEALAARYRASLPPAPSGAARSVDKLLANFQLLGLIARAFPDARILNCRRDPRDSGLSTFFIEFQRNELPWSYDLGHIARYYRDYERLMAHWAEHLPVPVLDVPYEELVSEPERWIARVLEFAELPWDERCLAHERGERSVFTASALQVREKLHDRSVGRWKRYAEHLGPLAELPSRAEGSTPGG